MKLNAWLVDVPGRKAALAKHLGVHPSMISQMVGGKEPIRVPPKHYRAIRDFTAGEVGLEDLLPEVSEANR